MDKSCYKCKGFKNCQSILDQPINREQADTWPVDCRLYTDVRIPHLDLNKTAQLVAQTLHGQNWANLSKEAQQTSLESFKSILLMNCKADD